MEDTEKDVYRMQMEFTALVERLRDRQQRNDEERERVNKRIEELEKVVDKIKEERAKLGGMAILLVAIGSILLWFSSVGSNIAKVLGK